MWGYLHVGRVDVVWVVGWEEEREMTGDVPMKLREKAGLGKRIYIYIYINPILSGDLTSFF